MVFSSSIFLFGFLPAVVTLYFALRPVSRSTRPALVAYEQIMLVVAEWFPSVHVKPRRIFRVGVKEGRDGDLARMLNLEGLLREQFVTVSGDAGICPEKLRRYGKSQVVRITRPAGELPRLLMFHDSFGIGLVPYLSKHFSESVFVRDKLFTPDLVRTEHPDIVIEEVVERMLMQVGR